MTLRVDHVSVHAGRTLRSRLAVGAALSTLMTAAPTAHAQGFYGEILDQHGDGDFSSDVTTSQESDFALGVFGPLSLRDAQNSRLDRVRMTGALSTTGDWAHGLLIEGVEGSLGDAVLSSYNRFDFDFTPELVPVDSGSGPALLLRPGTINTTGDYANAIFLFGYASFIQPHVATTGDFASALQLRLTPRPFPDRNPSIFIEDVRSIRASGNGSSAVDITYESAPSVFGNRPVVLTNPGHIEASGDGAFDPFESVFRTADAVRIGYAPGVTPSLGALRHEIHNRGSNAVIRSRTGFAVSTVGDTYIENEGGTIEGDILVDGDLEFESSGGRVTADIVVNGEADIAIGGGDFTGSLQANGADDRFSFGGGRLTLTGPGLVGIERRSVGGVSELYGSDGGDWGVNGGANLTIAGHYAGVFAVEDFTSDLGATAFTVAQDGSAGGLSMGLGRQWVQVDGILGGGAAGVIDFGDDADRLDVSATGSVIADVTMGAGDDLVIMDAQAGMRGPATGGGLQATLDGGDGEDTLIFASEAQTRPVLSATLDGLGGVTFSGYDYDATGFEALGLRRVTLALGGVLSEDLTVFDDPQVCTLASPCLPDAAIASSLSIDALSSWSARLDLQGVTTVLTTAINDALPQGELRLGARADFTVAGPSGGDGGGVLKLSRLTVDDRAELTVHGVAEAGDVVVSGQCSAVDTVQTVCSQITVDNALDTAAPGGPLETPGQLRAATLTLNDGAGFLARPGGGLAFYRPDDPGVTTGPSVDVARISLSGGSWFKGVTVGGLDQLDVSGGSLFELTGAVSVGQSLRVDDGVVRAASGAVSGVSDTELFNGAVIDIVRDFTNRSGLHLKSGSSMAVGGDLTARSLTLRDESAITVGAGLTAGPLSVLGGSSVAVDGDVTVANALIEGEASMSVGGSMESDPLSVLDGANVAVNGDLTAASALISGQARMSVGGSMASGALTVQDAGLEVGSDLTVDSLRLTRSGLTLNGGVLTASQASFIAGGAELTLNGGQAKFEALTLADQPVLNLTNADWTVNGLFSADQALSLVGNDTQARFLGGFDMDGRIDAALTNAALAFGGTLDASGQAGAFDLRRSSVLFSVADFQSFELALDQESRVEIGQSIRIADSGWIYNQGVLLGGRIDARETTGMIVNQGGPWSRDVRPNTSRLATDIDLTGAIDPVIRLRAGTFQSLIDLSGSQGADLLLASADGPANAFSFEGHVDLSDAEGVTLRIDADFELDGDRLRLARSGLFAAGASEGTLSWSADTDIRFNEPSGLFELFAPPPGADRLIRSEADAYNPNRFTFRNSAGFNSLTVFTRASEFFNDPTYVAIGPTGEREASESHRLGDITLINGPRGFGHVITRIINPANTSASMINAVGSADTSFVFRNFGEDEPDAFNLAYRSDFSIFPPGPGAAGWELQSPVLHEISFTNELRTQVRTINGSIDLRQSSSTPLIASALRFSGHFNTDLNILLGDQNDWMEFDRGLTNAEFLNSQVISRAQSISSFHTGIIRTFGGDDTLIVNDAAISGLASNGAAPRSGIKLSNVDMGAGNDLFLARMRIITSVAETSGLSRFNEQAVRVGVPDILNMGSGDDHVIFEFTQADFRSSNPALTARNTVLNLGSGNDILEFRAGPSVPGLANSGFGWNIQGMTIDPGDGFDILMLGEAPNGGRFDTGTPGRPPEQARPGFIPDPDRVIGSAPYSFLPFELVVVDGADWEIRGDWHGRPCNWDIRNGGSATFFNDRDGLFSGGPPTRGGEFYCSGNLPANVIVRERSRTTIQGQAPGIFSPGITVVLEEDAVLSVVNSVRSLFSSSSGARPAIVNAEPVEAKATPPSAAALANREALTTGSWTLAADRPPMFSGASRGDASDLDPFTIGNRFAIADGGPPGAGDLVLRSAASPAAHPGDPLAVAPLAPAPASRQAADEGETITAGRLVLDSLYSQGGIIELSVFSDGSVDQLVITNDMVIDGGQLVLSSADGEAPDQINGVELITVGGELFGGFDRIRGADGLAPTLTLGEDGKLMVFVRRTDVPFANFASTGNEIAVASALQRWDALTRFDDAPEVRGFLDGLRTATGPEFEAALQALTAEEHAAAPVALVDQHAGHVDRLMTAARRGEPGRGGAWGDAMTLDGRYSEGGDGVLTYDGDGFALGYDRSESALRVGLAYAQTQGDYAAGPLRQGGDFKAWTLGAYAGGSGVLGSRWSAMIGAGESEADVARAYGDRSGVFALNSSVQSGALALAAEITRPVRFGSVEIAPVVAADWIQLRIDEGRDEADTLASQVVGAEVLAVSGMEAGLRARYARPVGDGAWRMVADLDLRARTEIGRTDADRSIWFAADRTRSAFTVDGPSRDRLSGAADVEIGVTGEQIYVGAYYSGSAGDTAQRHLGGLKLRLSF